MPAYRSDRTTVDAQVYKVKDVRAWLKLVDETWGESHVDEQTVKFTEGGPGLSVEFFTPRANLVRKEA